MKVIISDDGESNVLFSNIPKKGTIPFLFSFSSSSVYLLALSQHKSYFELFFFRWKILTCAHKKRKQNEIF